MVAYFIQQPMVVYGTPPLITGNYRYLSSASKT
jgi:hypothetical protein